MSKEKTKKTQEEETEPNKSEKDDNREEKNDLNLDETTKEETDKNNQEKINKEKGKDNKDKNEKKKTKKKKSKKDLRSIIFYISFFAFIILGLSFLYLYFDARASQIIESVSDDKSAEPNENPEKIGGEENQFKMGDNKNKIRKNNYTNINLNTEDWKYYKSSNYYFTIKYPNDWEEPEVIPSDNLSDNYSLKLFFKKSGQKDEAMPAGFEMIVYLAKYYNIEDTAPLHEKQFTSKEGFTCPAYKNEIKIGPDAVYPATKVNVKPNHPCFREAYFVSAQRNSWIYNIVPVPKGGYHLKGYEGETKINAELPEFQKILENITFQNPPPPITAPKPRGAKKVNGKYVCRGDDPTRWSLQNEPGHLDLQCCLDPDETPNPWCSYSAENLAKVREMQADGPPKEWRKQWD